MILLASRSPQRSMLLTRADIAFDVVSTDCTEEAIGGQSPEHLAVERAIAKARSAKPNAAQQVLLEERKGMILGADTIAALGRDIIGKPKDRNDARQILGRLAGTSHTVITAHCGLSGCKDPNECMQSVAVALARVTMREMSPKEIEAYCNSGESDDRAGAYAIQETGDQFVTELQGSWDTVVGLHVASVERLWLELTGQHLRNAP